MTKKYEVVGIVLKEDEKTRIRLMAKHHGQSFNGYCREPIFERLREDELRKEHYDLLKRNTTERKQQPIAMNNQGGRVEPF